MLQQQTVDTFIIEMALISPIEKIISQLNNSEFSDRDIKWLDNKLDSFIQFAAKTLGINCVMCQPESVKPKYITTSYGEVYYKKYFTSLLEYFKSF